MVRLITDQENLTTFDSIRLVDLVEVIKAKGYHVEDVELRKDKNELLIICKRRANT